MAKKQSKSAKAPAKTANKGVPIDSIIIHVLASLKSSLEKDSGSLLDDGIRLERLKRSILKLEEIRLHFVTSPTGGGEALHAAVGRALVELTALADDPGFLEISGGRPFRINRGFGSEGERFMHAFIGRKVDIDQAIQKTKRLFEVLGGIPDEDEDISQDLRKVVPDQKIAPVQFAFHEGRLALARQSSNPDLEDESNISQSREMLVERGEKLLAELQASNCDRRLLESLRELQGDLKRQDNIIRLGLMNIGCEAMCTAFDNELPDALRGMLTGHTRGIAMYVAQFPEWQRFSEKAASVDLSSDDIQRLSETALKLIEGLESDPDLAEPEVPRTIKALQLLIANPALATKRAAYAVLRTLENLIAKTFQYFSDLISTTLALASSGLAKALSGLAIATLMSIALSAAVDMSPLAAKVADTGWLKTAADIVQKQLESLAN